jgi:prepilin-type processing-associated H-X9-DG protein
MTLAEVLTVIAVIAILVGLLLPAQRRVGTAAARTKCQNNLKQLMLGLHLYQDVGHLDSPGTPHGLPPGCFGPGATPEERLGWPVLLLPYFERGNLFSGFDLTAGYAGNAGLAAVQVNLFVCPSAPPGNPTAMNYVALAGVGLDAAARPAGAAGNGAMGYDRTIALWAVKDGCSNTICLAETAAGVGPWARGGPATLRGFDPADAPVSGPGRPFGVHERGFNVAMLDGSVRFVRDTVDPHMFAAAVTVGGRERVDLE